MWFLEGCMPFHTLMWAWGWSSRVSKGVVAWWFRLALVLKSWQLRPSLVSAKVVFALLWLMWK